MANFLHQNCECLLWDLESGRLFSKRFSTRSPPTCNEILKQSLSSRPGTVRATIIGRSFPEYIITVNPDQRLNIARMLDANILVRYKSLDWHHVLSTFSFRLVFTCSYLKSRWRRLVDFLYGTVGNAYVDRNQQSDRQPLHACIVGHYRSSTIQRKKSPVYFSMCFPYCWQTYRR